MIDFRGIFSFLLPNQYAVSVLTLCMDIYTVNESYDWNEYITYTYTIDNKFPEHFSTLLTWKQSFSKQFDIVMLKLSYKLVVTSLKRRYNVDLDS